MCHDTRIRQPCTEKLHQIMARTAIFVSEHGGQSEIVLRVKQGGNPTFGFLMPDNQLHPYFRFLVKHPQLLKHDNTMEKKNSDSGGALSLLGSMYGTGEDDENANDDDSNDESKRRGKEESPSEKGPTMQQAVTYPKEKSSVVPKKSHLIAPSSTGRKKGGTAAKVGKKPDAKPVILEPPTFLKRNIDKAVEFIQKNGRKFEAKLIEQDKAIGRFPFLLATNQYHSYYLKILEEALESKCSDSNTKRRSEERGRDETVPDELVDDLPFNPHKKEKFTMLLGNNIRREIVDQPSKPIQQSGVTADEAAMIVLAATRGQSPFPGTSTNDSDSKNLSSNKEKTSEVNSNEASLSEPTMTNEQKIKAERLKRAKLFAAMIKSGAQPVPSANESKVEGSNHAPLDEPKHEKVNAAEPKLEEFDEASAKERNYRKKNIKEEDDEESDDVHSMKKLHSEDQESKHRHRHSHRRHKHNHYSEDEDEHSKNRRRRHRHRSHRKHSDSDSEEEDDCKDRHRRRSRRKYSESEEEDKHEKSSRHRRRHSKHDLSEDEDLVRSHKHRKKHHRSPLEKEDIEEGELCDVTNAASVKSSDNNGTEVPSDLRAKIRAMLLETL